MVNDFSLPALVSRQWLLVLIATFVSYAWFGKQGRRVGLRRNGFT